MKRFNCVWSWFALSLFIQSLLAQPTSTFKDYDLPVQPALGSNLIGPVYPPPLGVDWSGSGNSGAAGGAIWIYQNVVLANFDSVYWGPVNDAINVSFNDSIYTANEVLQFSPESSNLGNGVLIWNGTTFFPGAMDTVYTRYTMRLLNYATGGALSALPAVSITLPANVGGVLWVTSGLEYTVNFIFEASFSRNGPYQPALDFFDANKPGPAIPYLSFLAGFYYVNSPPQLTANNLLEIDEGQSATVTAEFLSASDVESGKQRILFNIAPSGLGEAPHFGWLKRDEDSLRAGDFFSQSDLENNRITYRHNGTENLLDNFTFNIVDGDGGSTPSGELLTYTFTFVINPVNDPPVPVSGTAVARVNTPLEWHFNAADVDTPSQILYYSLVKDGSKGTTTILNDSTGLFRYTPDTDALGNDTIIFQVYDGYAYSDQNGIMAITIEDIPVLPQGYILIGRANPCQILMVNPADGQQTVYKNLFPSSTNPDLRANDLVLDKEGNLFAVTNDTGLVRVDYLTGETTILAPVDSFSQPIGLDISADGGIFICDGDRGVIKVNPLNGTSSVLSSGGLMTFPVGITAAADGYLYITDAADLDSANGSVIRIDPVTGSQTLVSENQLLADPAHIISASNGMLYLSDFDGFGGTGHVLTVDPADGRQKVIASGDLLIDPLGIDLYSGKIFVTNLFNGSIVEIDTTDGSQKLVFSDTTLTETFGLHVIQSTISHIPSVKFDPVPDMYVLFQNYPNPFNPMTTIRYQLPVPGQIRLEVFDITGRKVKTLLNRYQKSGEYTVTFDTAGRASGIYIYRMLVDGHVMAQRKMVILK